jgi:putative Ca2+/H+ antiporter (TMEM165/GDT1 family)
MDFKIFLVTFATVFLAQMGDKTQLAALTMTAQSGSPLSVALGACLALIVATLLGVAVGGVLAQFVPPSLLKKGAAIAFILIGLIMLFGKW